MSYRRGMIGVLVFWVSCQVLASDASSLLPEAHFGQLERILTQIDDRAPELLIERARVAATDAGIGAADAVDYPEVGLRLNLLARNDIRDSDPRYQFIASPQAQVFARHQLYYWGALDAAQSISRLRDAMARGQYREAYRLTLLQIRETYLQALLQSREMSVIEQQIAANEAVVARLESQQQQGDATEGEVTSARIELDALRLQLDAAEARRQLTMERLSLLAGNDAPIQLESDAAIFEYRDFMIYTSGAEAAIFATTPAESAAYLAKLDELAIAREELTIIESQTLPNVDLLGRVFHDQIESDDSDNVNRLALDFVVQVNWNLFDGWRTKHEKLENLAEQRRLEREADYLRRQHELTFRELLGQRAFLRRQLNLQLRRVELLKADMDLAERGMDEGVTTASTFLENRATYLAGELEALRMVFNYAGNTMQLISLTGHDPQLRSELEF